MFSAARTFQADQRGFNSRYTSFVEKLTPGANIKESVLEAIKKAFSEERNLFERREVRKNVQHVQSPKNVPRVHGQYASA